MERSVLLQSPRPRRLCPRSACRGLATPPSTATPTSVRERSPRSPSFLSSPGPWCRLLPLSADVSPSAASSPVFVTQTEGRAWGPPALRAPRGSRGKHSPGALSTQSHCRGASTGGGDTRVHHGSPAKPLLADACHGYCHCCFTPAVASRGHGNEMQRAVELRGACAPGNSTRFPFVLETARRECTQRTDFHRDYSDIC